MPDEYKIIFTGSMGAGKTTAISSVAGLKMIKTEAVNNDPKVAKATTTVGFDYGEVRLPDGSVLRLYGTPGQRRFSFLWRVVARGALGIVILVDNSSPDPIQDLDVYLENFKSLADAGAAVIGIGRAEQHPDPSLERYYEHLEGRGLMLPIFQVDVRKSQDVLMMLDVLFGMLELAEPQEQ